MSLVQPTIEGKNVYLQGGYYHRARWSTYYHQFQHLFDRKVKSVLEVGPGGGVTTSVLRQHGIHVTTLDFDPAIKPDVVGDVLDLPFSNGQFDASVGFEILEHLPFESFAVALKEMARVSKKYVLISLPDHAHSLFRMRLKVPFFKERDIHVRIPAINNKKYWAPCGHYWEVGNIDFPLSKIRAEIERAGLRLERTYVAIESPMTRFFLMEKR